MVVFPNAKINIGLNIVGKRDDGFHNIETVFYPIPWTDVLEIIPSLKSSNKKSPVNFKASGIATYSPKEKNLCVRAYQLLAKDFSLKPVRIYLHKNIPVGAGLGGGSSDAAFTLSLLNKMFELQLTQKQIAGYAAELGSDCAFFIKNEPAYATQRGDVLEPMELQLSGYQVVLVKPDIHINTAAAYSKVSPSKPSRSLKTLTGQPVNTWKECIKNDFEESVFLQYPELRDIKTGLYQHGAIYASMSGSGSTIYGIFENKINRKELFPDCIVWQGELK